MSRRTRPLVVVAVGLAVSACGSRSHAQASLDQADSLSRSGHYQEAIEAYRGLSRRQTSWQVTRGLAVALATIGEYGEAADALTSAIQDSLPAAHQLWNTLGEVLARQGRDAEARAAFERAVAQGAANRLSAQLNLAILDLRRGQLDQATQAFDAFIDVYNRGAARTASDLQAVAQAVRYLGRTDPQLYKDALRAYDEAVAADPRDLSIQAEIGDLFLEKYRSDEATTTFDRILEQNPNHPAAILGLARARHFDGSSEAFALTQRSLAVNPNLVEARTFLARLQIDLEDFRAAAAEAERALAVNPRAVKALAMLAAARYLSDDSLGFVRARDSALGIDPHNASFYTTLAELAARNRLYGRAVEFAGEAIRLDSLAWRGYALRGANRLRTGAIADGRRDLETAFAGDPYDLWTKNTLDLLDVLGRHVEVRSPRFVFLLDPKEADLVRLYLEPLAEEAFDSLASRYRIRPPTPIRVEVYPHHADFSVRTIGLVGLGALGVSFGPVVAMDAPSARPPGAFHWGATLWHELAHTFHMSASAHRVPRWFTEGLAVLEERRARPGWGDDVTPGFLIAFREGRLAPVSDLNQGFMRPAYPEQVIFSYYQASLVFELIEREYGFDSIRRILAAYRDGAQTPAVFRTILGIEPEAFDRTFTAYLETRFARALSALRHGQDGNRADTTDFIAQLGLGKVLLSEGRPDDAVGPLRRAKALFPEYLGGDSPRWLLGQAYRAQGRLDEAAAELADLTARNAKHYPALQTLADIESERGNVAAAARALEALMFVYPYDIARHRGLADQARAAGDPATELRERRAVLALDPVDRSQALYHLARAYRDAGDLAAARRAVLEALERAPNYQDALDLLLDLRAAQDRGTE